MAPALTEPLSSAEKLSSSTASATPTTLSYDSAICTTRASVSAATAVISATESDSASSSYYADKVDNQSSKNSSASVRITRSKDAYQRVFEQTVSEKNSTADLLISTQRLTPHPKLNGANSDEQMGLSAANSNNKNNHNNNNNNSNNNNNNTSSDNLNPVGGNESGINSTNSNAAQQLLADLTNDFEEAISVEISSRKQQNTSKLNKNIDRKNSTNSGANAPMEALTDEPKDSTLITIAGYEENQRGSISQSQDEKGDKEKNHFKNELDKKSKTVTTTTAAISNERAQIISVEELPLVSTDSTMTASEIEDNLEERLSQLDGGDTPTTSSFGNSNITNLVQNTRPFTISKIAQQPQQQHQHHQHQQLQPQHQQQQQQSSQIQQQQIQIQTQTQTQPSNQMYTPNNAHQVTIPLNSITGINNLQSQTCNNKEVITAGTGNTGDELQDQDLEEVLKALKGFDGNASADALCDLNVLFNEVYTTLNYEDINQQAVAAKPTPLQELRIEIERTQQTIQRKIDFMLRRMRKMQARYMCKHASEEISGIFEWCARAASKNRNGNNVTSGNTINGDISTKSAISVISARPPVSHWDHEKQTPVSSSQMYMLLRKLETSANAQQVCHVPNSSYSANNNYHMRKQRKSGVLQDQFVNNQNNNSTLSSGSQGSNNSNTNTNNNRGDVVVPILDENVVEEMTQITGLLQTEMREVQNAIDSEVTESSSGCESADEMVIYNNPSQKTLPIAKRAAWRYTRDRAAIASRWSWLLTQIADLEIKIRQHNELHQELIRKKGLIKCDADASNKNIVDNLQTQSVNGYKNDSMPPLVVSDSSSKEESSVEGPSGCSRTRGFATAQFRKRKLLQTTNIHTISKKAARPSTIKCGCQWPLNPCALCTGRADPTAPRDLPDTMMKRDRVALLDPGYHPVLSFPENVSSSIHFEAIARQPEWQQRVTRLQPKSIVKHVLKAEREAAAAAGLHLPKKYGESLTKRRYIKKKDRLRHQDDKDSTVSTATTATADEMSPGNGTGSFSTSTTPLVANSKLLAHKNDETDDRERNIPGVDVINSGIEPQQGPSASIEHIQQLHASDERLSFTKLRSIQSQPSTFIIDLQQSQK